MRIYVVRPSFLKKVESKTQPIFIVIDTFRATTSLSVLKKNRVNQFFIVKNKQEAFFLKENYCLDCLLIGEERGFKIEGFDYGNTPSIFYNEEFSSEKVIFTSSNGAKTLLLLEPENYVYLAALVNLTCVAQTVSLLAKEINSEIIIIPVGIHEKSSVYSIEDWITATLLAEKIKEITSYQIAVKDDFWVKTQTIFQKETNLEYLLFNSHHGQYLRKIGYDEDVIFSTSTDKIKNFLKVKKWHNFNGLKFVELE